MNVLSRVRRSQVEPPPVGIVLILCWLAAAPRCSAAGDFAKYIFMHSECALPFQGRHDPNIRYDAGDFTLRFEMRIPSAPKPGEVQAGLGVVVYLDPHDTLKEAPPSWWAELDRRHLFFCIVQNAGNGRPLAERAGLAVATVTYLQTHTDDMTHDKSVKIDPNRVYAAGLSGGARVATALAYYAGSTFKGVIADCGADFCRPVPAVTPAISVPTDAAARDASAGEYGVIRATLPEVAAARKTRIVLITGPDDFRHANIVDEFTGGYQKDGYQAMLLDVPGTGHEVAPPEAVSAAMRFVDGPLSSPGDRSQPTAEAATAARAMLTAPPGLTSTPMPPAPAWGKLDPSNWPPMVCFNGGETKGHKPVQGMCINVRLPDGRSVIAIPPSEFAKGTTLEDIAAGRWEVSSIGYSGRSVAVQRPAVPLVPNLPAVLMTTGSGTSTGTVLSPRPTPVEPGEPVFVVEISGDPGKQAVRHATVVGGTDDEFTYTFDSDQSDVGHTGAAVLDADGRLVGLQLGRYALATPTGRALPVTALLRDVPPVERTADKVAETSTPAAAGPSAAPWAKGDPSKWPPISCTNDGELTNHHGIGGTSFLLRLPDGSTAAATAGHVFGPEVPPAAVATSIVSWKMRADANPNRYVSLKKLAMTVPATDPPDSVLMAVPKGVSLPAAVLDPRTTSVTEGETIYLIGFVEGGKAGQSVNKGKVVFVGDNSFNYKLDVPRASTGFSGAPVVDARGRLVGMHVAHETSGSDPSWIAMNVPTLLKNATYGPIAKPAPGETTSTASGEAPTVSTDTVADHALAMAEMYQQAGNIDRARQKFHEVLVRFPGTAAAAKAAIDLRKMEVK